MGNLRFAALCSFFAHSCSSVYVIGVQVLRNKQAVKIQYPQYNPRKLVTLVRSGQLEKGVAVYCSLLAAGIYPCITGNTGETFIIRPWPYHARVVLFFHKLHVRGSIKPFLKKCELRFDSDFDKVDNIIRIH